MYVYGMRYLHHEVHELDGYNQEFWNSSGYSLNVTVLLFRLSDLITFKQKPLYRSYILSKHFFASTILFLKC